MIRFVYRSAIALVLALALAPAALAKKPRQAVNLEAEIDALMTVAFPADKPGAAVAVVKDGNVVYRKAFGLANLELKTPMQPEMVFEIGSVTKQFTATAILMLIEQGKLSLDDDIRKFFPDYPDKGAKITIEHLLTHTSGIKSYTGTPKWRPLWREDVTPQQLIDLTKDEPLEFQPGSRWAYNNTGYVMLGAIIEKLSGMSYPDYVAKTFFEPLGMKTALYASHETIVPNRAYGYDRQGDSFRNTIYLSFTHPYAAGSLMMSVDDLVVWEEAVAAGKLISKGMWERAFTPYKLSSGETASYGYGWETDVYEGRALARHNGGIPGFISEVVRVPSEKVYVVLLTNVTPPLGNPGFIATKVAAVAMGEPYREPAAITLDERLLDDYVGVYRVDEKTTRAVTREGARLFTQRAGGPKSEIFAVSQTEFFYKDSFTRVRFERDASGKVTRMVVRTGDGKEAPAPKTADAPPAPLVAVKVDPAILAAYVGEYELKPDFILTVTLEEGRLMTQATGQPKFEIFARSETEFFPKVFEARITFVRGADGKVEKLVLNQGGRSVEARKR